MDSNPAEITVLVVNDQKPVALMWERIINYTNGMHCVGVAIDGEEAVAMSRELTPAVVVMDVMMPGIHGFEATRRVLADRPDTLVIIYSARQDIEAQAYECGAVACLGLPVTPGDLVGIIRAVYMEHRPAL